MERNLSVELRPKSLDEFIGCEKIIGPIKEGIKQGRVDSTYVIAGPPGTGKTSLARAIIRYVNGVQDYYDINEPDTTELGADEIRVLVSEARLSPQWGRYKGIIVDEAHKLVAATQTMLLKATEEPCPSTIWFICTSEPGKLAEALRRRGSFYVMEGLTAEQMAALVLRAVKYAKADSKYESNISELVQGLLNHEVTSPGLVIRAVEKWITGVPAAEASQVSEVTTVDTFAISKAAAFGNWTELQQLLKDAPRSAARDIRSNTAGFFRSILVKEPAGSKRAERCVWAIETMANLSNQSAFEEGLIWASTCAALYKICVGQKEYISKKG